MRKRTLIALVATAWLLAGCVTVPTGPAVTVLPGTYKSFGQFQADDGTCRQYANAMIGGTAAGQPAQDAAAANAIGSAALGAAAGAIIGSVSGQAGAGAAIGAGTGLLFGSAAGGNVAAASSYALQRRYDSAYVQCMYARGNQIPGRVTYSGPAPGYAPAYPSPNSGSYPPPNSGSYPPPNYPPPGSGNYPPSNSGSYPPPNYPPPPGASGAR
jgi:hypothetical protein